MEQHAVEQLKTIARINRSYPNFQLTRSEKLERWAEILELDPGRPLLTLRETEYQPEDERAALRANGTALSAAFGDPVLRSAGLRDDTYGEARRFFELSDRQMHKLVCFCHYGTQVSAHIVANHVRGLAASGTGGMIARLMAFIRG